jgi:predicted PurR-regulated permease PerM
MIPKWSKTTKVFVVIALIIGFISLMVFLAPVLDAIIIAALIAILLEPVVRWVIQRTRWRRSVVASLIFLVILLILIAIPASIGTAVFNQIEQLENEFQEAVIALENLASTPVYFFGFYLYPQVLLEYVERFTSEAVAIVPGSSFNLLSGVTTNLLWLLLVLVSLYYFLKDGTKIKLWLAKIPPEPYKDDFQRLLTELEDTWSTFLRVQFLIFIVLGVLMGIGVLLIIWLFRSGLVVFSPLALILLLVLIFTGAQQVDNLWLRPQLMGQKLRLHPGIIFAGLTGALIVSGLLGALLVVPLMASAKVLGRYIYARLLDQSPWEVIAEEPEPEKPEEQIIREKETKSN